MTPLLLPLLLPLSLADLVAASTPFGPDQAAERLGVRRADFDPTRTLGRIETHRGATDGMR